MKKFNRAISLLLCFVMVCCLLPVAPASAAGYEATNLRWGTMLMYEEDGTVSETAMPGTAFFYGNPYVYYLVEYYQVGDEEYPVMTSIVVPEPDGRASDNYLTVAELENGDYYYVVTPVSSVDFETPVGESVRSGNWWFFKTSAKCATPTGNYWTWPTANFTLPAFTGISGIQVEFFFGETANETPSSYGWSSWYVNHNVSRIDVFKDLLDYCGAGYYYFRTRTLSSNLDKCYHSDWSQLSGSYYYDGNPFVDVSMSEYYGEPVLWAVENGITNGLDDTHFGPDSTCTRGQIVTFLWRSCGSPEPKSGNNPFYDVAANDYFYKAVLWAVENGITSGMSANSFAPNDPCTRGQVATFLWRAEGKPGAKAANSFSDVASGAYYYDAVLWAVANGVTNGMGNGTFAPDAPCTRGQIVTFLYRAMA